MAPLEIPDGAIGGGDGFPVVAQRETGLEKDRAHRTGQTHDVRDVGPLRRRVRQRVFEQDPVLQRDARNMVKQIRVQGLVFQKRVFVDVISQRGKQGLSRSQRAVLKVRNEIPVRVVHHVQQRIVIGAQGHPDTARVRIIDRFDLGQAVCDGVLHPVREV